MSLFFQETQNWLQVSSIAISKVAWIIAFFKIKLIELVLCTIYNIAICYNKYNFDDTFDNTFEN